MNNIKRSRLISKIETIIFVLFVFMSFSACSTSVDSIVSAHNDADTVFKADAGGDKTTYAASYAVFDASKSKIPSNESIKVIEWLQNPNNPEEIFPYTTSSLSDNYIVGFQKEGTYKFALKITCTSGKACVDSFTVTANKRQQSLIENAILEIYIRQILNYKVGELTASKLLLLDTLTSYNICLKNKLTNLNGIEYCTNLKSIALGLQSIIDMQPLSTLMKLEYLDLDQNRTITDITPICNLTNLKTLDLFSNPIKDISGFDKLVNLITLNLNYTLISDITSLRGLVNLETLWLDGNGTGVNFSSIEPLRYLTKLKWLWIGGRGITDIIPLKNLTDISLLYLNFNKLKEISALSNMKKIVRLYIEQNEITNISGIKNLESLDYLAANNNQITDISELQYLANLHLIGLAGNKIEDIKPLVDNPNLNSGVYIYLTGNPLNDKSVNEYIPALVKRGVTIYK